VRFAFLSGLHDWEVEELGLAAGADTYWRKPFTINGLLDKVAETVKIGGGLSVAGPRENLGSTVDPSATN
jgi:DNA-binding response OmpR family regulator